MKDIKTDSNNMLLIGIGNSGRGDDGLGWKFTDMVKRYDGHLMDYEYRYQLQIEDSVLISNYTTVIFADASHETAGNGFEMKTCTPTNHYFFSSHIQSPEAILYLANDLYDKRPEAYTMAITGNYWELKTCLSREAEKNLHSAFDFFIQEFLPTVLQKKGVNKTGLPV
jgi:hydrogenase maturation protease